MHSFSTNKNQNHWKIIAIHRCKIKTGFVTSFLKPEPKKNVSLSTSLTVQIIHFPIKKKVFVYARETVSQEKEILMCNITNAENKTGRGFAQWVYICISEVASMMPLMSWTKNSFLLWELS